MDEIDREVLVLRHFEMLSNEETAQVLGLKPSAASNRHIRALKRLKEIMAQVPGFGDSHPAP
jgi:RNA polymerase sigma-70 factor (ECF subfamily)